MITADEIKAGTIVSPQDSLYIKHIIIEWRDSSNESHESLYFLGNYGQNPFLINCIPQLAAIPAEEMAQWLNDFRWKIVGCCGSVKNL